MDWFFCPYFFSKLLSNSRIIRVTVIGQSKLFIVNTIFDLHHKVNTVRIFAITKIKYILAI